MMTTLITQTDRQTDRQIDRDTSKGYRLQIPTFVYRHLQGNPNSSGLQFKVVYWQ